MLVKCRGGSFRDEKLPRREARNGSSRRLALRDGIDFKQSTSRQSRNLNRRSRRARGAEKLAVNGVHFRKICHVREEHRRLDNLGKVRTARFQNLAHVRQRLSRFRFDATFDDFHGFRDERDAAARVEKAASLVVSFRFRSERERESKRE